MTNRSGLEAWSRKVGMVNNIGVVHEVRVGVFKGVTNGFESENGC